jgi:hypothetical protein
MITNYQRKITNSEGVLARVGERGGHLPPETDNVLRSRDGRDLRCDDKRRAQHLLVLEQDGDDCVVGGVLKGPLDVPDLAAAPRGAKGRLQERKLVACVFFLKIQKAPVQNAYFDLRSPFPPTMTKGREFALMMRGMRVPFT